MLLGSKSYGRRIVDSDIAIYPEVGPEGTYRPFDQLPYQLFGNEWIGYLVGPMYSHADPVVSSFSVHKLDHVTLMFVLTMASIIMLLVILRGMISILKQDHSGGGIRLISFFIVCGILHVFAWLTSPYLYIPTRYFMFSLPFLITFLFPWSLYTLLDQLPKLHSSPKRRDAVFLAIICVYLMAFGGRGNVDFSVSIVEKSSQPLFDAIAALPKDAVIAGWPSGEIRSVEYITRRNIFLTSAVHQVLHLNFVRTMRQRMDALFDAYLSTDAAPVYRLRQEFGVTHLLVDTRDFAESTHAPEYFAPWRERIAPRLAEIKGKEYLMNGALQKKSAVYNQDSLILLDLAKLP